MAAALLIYSAAAQSPTAVSKQAPGIWGTVSSVIPEYPAEARSAGLSGDVEIKIKLNERGAVTDADFVQGLKQFKDTCVKAARQWVFVPFLKLGKPSATSGRIIFSFDGHGSVQTSYKLNLSQGFNENLIPEAMIPVTEAEKEWWEKVRKAGCELYLVGRKFSQAYQRQKSGTLSDAQASRLRTQVFASFRLDFTAAEENFRLLLREGQQKSYRVPLPSHLPLVVCLEQGLYTEAAREDKVHGVVELVVSVQLDGAAKVVKITKGLAGGLTESSIQAVGRMIFFPASNEGKIIAYEMKGVEFIY